MSLTSNIRKCIHEQWPYEEIPDGVIAVCFHAQKVNNGFELFFEGYDDYYDEHDTWLLSDTYQPANNFFNMGIESILLSDQDFYTIYKMEVEIFLNENIQRFNSSIKYFCVRHPLGMPELLLKR